MIGGQNQHQIIGVGIQAERRGEDRRTCGAAFGAYNHLVQFGVYGGGLIRPHGFNVHICGNHGDRAPLILETG